MSEWKSIEKKNSIGSLEGGHMCAMAEGNAHARNRGCDSCSPRGFHLALTEPSASLKSPFHRGQPSERRGGASRVPCCSSIIHQSAPSSTPESHLKSHQLHHSRLKRGSWGPEYLFEREEKGVFHLLEQLGASKPSS